MCKYMCKWCVWDTHAVCDYYSFRPIPTQWSLWALSPPQIMPFHPFLLQDLTTALLRYCLSPLWRGGPWKHVSQWRAGLPHAEAAGQKLPNFHGEKLLDITRPGAKIRLGQIMRIGAIWSAETVLSQNVNSWLDIRLFGKTPPVKNPESNLAYTAQWRIYYANHFCLYVLEKYSNRTLHRLYVEICEVSLPSLRICR